MTTTGRAGGPHGPTGKAPGSGTSDSPLDGVGSGGTGGFDFGAMLLAISGVGVDAPAVGPRSLKLVPVARDGLDATSARVGAEAANDGSIEPTDAAGSTTIDLAALGLLSPELQAAVAAALAARAAQAAADPAHAAGSGQRQAASAVVALDHRTQRDVAGLASAAVRREAGFAGAAGDGAPNAVSAAAALAAVVDGGGATPAELRAAMTTRDATDGSAASAHAADAPVGASAPQRDGAAAAAERPGSARATSFAAAMSHAMSRVEPAAVDAASASLQANDNAAGQGGSTSANGSSGNGLSAAFALPGAAAVASPHGHTPQIAAAPVVAELPAAVGSREFAPALGAQVSLLVQDGVQRAELRLNPAEMGPIAVQIDLTDRTHAVIHFAAEVASTRSAIEQALPDLAASLRDAGLTLVGGGVSEHPRGQQDSQQPSQADAGSAGGQGADRGSRDPRSGQGAERLAGANDLTNGAGRPTATRLRGMVDLLA